jgi:hypothetical protein
VVDKETAASQLVSRQNLMERISVDENLLGASNQFVIVISRAGM